VTVFAAPAPGWTLPPVGTASWVPSQGGEIPPNAVKGGHDSEDLYVGRARHEGALIPGKIVPSHGVCYVSWGGQEHGKNEYEVCGAASTHSLLATRFSSTFDIHLVKKL
jgi:hypothetical protein